MHEQGIAADLVLRAKEAAGVDADRIETLRLLVGPLAGVTSNGIENAVVDRAIDVLGYAPAVVVELSDDLQADHADGVVLKAVTVGG